MPLMQFRRPLAILVLQGTKRQTLRATLPGGVVVGARCTMCNGYRAGATFGHAVITAVDEVEVGDLTDRDARLDGFADLAALRAALAATYPGRRRLHRIAWREINPTPTGDALLRDPSSGRRTRTPRKA